MTKVLETIELSVVRGISFDDLELRVSGDKTTWVVRGEIVKQYGDRTLVVEWDFDPLVYDVEADLTIIKPRLGGQKTQLLPATQLYGDKRVGLCVSDIHLVQLSEGVEVARDEVLRAEIRVFPSATLVA